jgi:cation transport ATPase
VLRAIASAEGRSSHPLAAAIVKTALGEGVALSADVDGYETLEGEGISAAVDGRPLLIGNRRLAARLGWLDAAEGALAEKPGVWESEAATVLWAGEGGKLLAVLAVADKVTYSKRACGDLSTKYADKVTRVPRPRPCRQVRDEAREAVARLHAAGIKTVMLTGDNEGTAAAVSKQVGLTAFEASLKPVDKVGGPAGGVCIARETLG